MSQIVKREEKDLVRNNGEKIRKFLEFQLGDGSTYLLPAEIVMEIISLNSRQILPVPQVPPSVMGVYQWRGETLWIIDIGILCGFAPLSWGKNNFLLVLQIGEEYMGLVVPQVKDIETYDLSKLKEPLDDLFHKELRPFLQGFFVLEEQKLAMLFNASAIVSKNLWHGEK